MMKGVGAGGGDGGGGGGGGGGRVVEFAIPSAEKRREGGKHYVYEIVVTYEGGTKVRIWRRYSQFDALRDTIQDILGPEQPLPRLTRKLYLKRSAVHEVAIHRQPKLIRFLKQLLPLLADDMKLSTVLTYFLTPTDADKARAKLPDPDTLLRFDGQHVHRRRRASDQQGGMGPVKVKALMDVVPEDSGEELAFREGDILTVIARYDDGWLECTLNDTKGLVSPEYVEEADASEGGGSGQHSVKPTSAVEELLTTERQYLQNLVEVRDTFFPVLRGLVSAPEAKVLFNNWAELIPLHEACVQDLEASAGDLNATLTRHFQTFEGPYCRYCAGIPAAQDLYQAKCNDKAFAKFEASFPTLNKPTLNHFMRPFQRVLKYPLLLREVVSSTDLDMSSAVDAASRLAEQANLNMNNPQHRLNKEDISGPEGVQRAALLSSTSDVLASSSSSSSSSAVALRPPAPPSTAKPGLVSPPPPPPPPTSKPQPPPAHRPPPPAHKPQPSPPPPPSSSSSSPLPAQRKTAIRPPLPTASTAASTTTPSSSLQHQAGLQNDQSAVTSLPPPPPSKPRPKAAITPPPPPAHKPPPPAHKPPPAAAHKPPPPAHKPPPPAKPAALSSSKPAKPPKPAALRRPPLKPTPPTPPPPPTP
ncbi:hypothetical protein PTSG_00831 [Salpingoeca rosetta]|uniref:Uncharacterized protein n=1 Tax=Salpingoeca rosetta (strain ATCC 50818 / BSB-021) TaxID=946362 RepID=F2TXL5_SALR5|nr:uncharacterized protein PTSG_00831 [Salpingoeca rosetta]EGD76124.1 hypothetical protein PTSG_00831 [Salpingoeca rosetta]|eukprot:XP_004998299.1 hypothetical protein PTSG_00831 [Salpingoeca rosetta]